MTLSPAYPKHAPDVAAPVTIQDARAAGAVPGTMISAPLAPAQGPITVGVETSVPATGTTVGKEPLVVVTAKAFWSSPTVIWLRRLVAASFGLAFVATFEPYVVPGGKSWDTFTIAAAWSPFLHAFEAAALSALFAYFKVRDNNPIQK